ncbi:MAG: hypothetical protein F7B59_05920 [Desulfurococcales archaeon]|nr:hypothetical protein [Desulfurococcales archaeon]
MYLERVLICKDLNKPGNNELLNYYTSMFGDKDMGMKTVFIIVIILLGIGYLALNNGEININFTTQKGSSNHWTNDNFTQAATDPMSHKGEKVNLTLLMFNNLDISGLKGMEAYLGTVQQLQANPMDASRRVYLSYNPGETSGSIVPGDCIHVTGTIEGVAHITTQDNSLINVTYIKSNTLEKVPCSP